MFCKPVKLTYVTDFINAVFVKCCRLEVSAKSTEAVFEIVVKDFTLCIAISYNLAVTFSYSVNLVAAKSWKLVCADILTPDFGDNCIYNIPVVIVDIFALNACL